jgi:small subunit ribosomal protein S20
MANTFSALKRIRQIERRTRINRIRKSRLRTQIRKMRRALEAKDVKAAEALLPQTFSIIDRAAKWGIIKRNTAARYKSRLHRRLKALMAAAPAA